MPQADGSQTPVPAAGSSTREGRDRPRCPSTCQRDYPSCSVANGIESLMNCKYFFASDSPFQIFSRGLVMSSEIFPWKTDERLAFLLWYFVLSY